MTIVDFGTGSGERTLRLARKGLDAKVIGVDTFKTRHPNTKTRQKARELGAEFKNGNFSNPGLFRRGSIDVAEFNWSLYPHDRQKALSNISKWLKKDGKVVIRFWGPYLVKHQKFPNLPERERQSIIKEEEDAMRKAMDFLRENGFSVVEGLQYSNYKRPSITNTERRAKKRFRGNKPRPFYPFIVARRGKSPVFSEEFMKRTRKRRK